MTSALPHPEPDGFSAATAAVNEWRGRCVAAFARAELAATETLVRLAKGDAEVGLPYKPYERFTELEAALSDPGDIARAAAGALASFREHLPLRTFLCHGDAKIAVERSGRWLTVLTVVTLRASRVERSTLTIGEVEAAARMKALWRDQSRLTNRLALIAPDPAGDMAMPLRIHIDRAAAIVRSCPVDRAG